MLNFAFKVPNHFDSLILDYLIALSIVISWRWSRLVPYAMDIKFEQYKTFRTKNFVLCEGCFGAILPPRSMPVE